MNWEIVGAISEFVSAAVVVVTVIYLARQIHQVNLQSQASARYSYIEAYGQMNTSISSDKQVASVFRRGFKGLQLDEDESFQFFALMGQFLNTWSALYDLHQEGLLPENQWTMVRKDIIAMLTEAGGRSFWLEHGKHGVHDAFKNAVDETLASDETSYTMN